MKSNIKNFQKWLAGNHLSDVKTKIVRQDLKDSKKKSVEGVYTKDGKRLVPYLNAEQEDQIMSHYYESNKKLARLIGCENKLMKYGYFK